MSATTASSTAIIGAGLIGTSWAALLSAHGHATRLWDPGDEWVRRVDAGVASARAQLRELGCEGAGPVTCAPSLEDAVHGAPWVLECTPESLPIKRDVYAKICAAAPRDAVLASSTSSFTWSDLAPFVADPSRLITAHPFNPPHLMPLVEIYARDAALGRRACEWFRALDRRPILLRRDATGHVANRLASALWREAVHIVAAGIADVEDVDSAMVDGPGLRWSAIGPHMAYHLGGGAGGIRNYLNHLGDSQLRRWQDLGSPTLGPEVREAIAVGVEREIAGRSVAELACERDQILMAALKSRRGSRARS
jgi:3-hydroxyacyl-CoA dehydrogenase